MSKAKIYYFDIGDYLSREEKLTRIKKFGSVNNVPWQELHPNADGDWIRQRNDVFGSFIPMGDKEDNNSIWIKGIYCRGLETARDGWVYQSNKRELLKNIKGSIEFFNSESERYKERKVLDRNALAKDIVSYDDTKISWSRAFIADIENGRKKAFDEKCCVKSVYRPFYKQYLYFSREQNNVVSRLDSFFPNPTLENLVICVSGLGGSKENTTIISNLIPDLNCLDSGTQCFPLYYYEERQKSSPTLFDEATESEYIRRDGISDFILERARQQYRLKGHETKYRDTPPHTPHPIPHTLTKEDIFYYVYGFLHSPDYREKFANDLKKMLPRLPLVEDVRDFWAFSKAGRKLAELHINYEKVPPLNGVTVTGAELLSFLDTEPAGTNLYHVVKMRFPRKDQKDTVLYNSRITISNIPEKAYEYVVNGKSAIEWVMERYQITTHKESGIRNDPNDWAAEVGNPRYILDLLLSIINVSVQTVEIVEGLPRVEFENL